MKDGGNSITYGNNINEIKNELIYLLDEFKQKNNDLDTCLREFNLIKEEFNSLKEITIKTKDFLLLEVESSFDKQKMIKSKQDSKIDSFREIVDLLKNENNVKLNEISFLNNKLDKFNQIIIDKNNLINSFKLNINELNAEISSLKDSLEGRDVSINELNAEISSLKDSLEGRDVSINELNKKINFLKNLISKKNNNIELLKDEINILKINE